MATAIMIGSISCPLEQTVLVHKTRTVKRERMVPRTVLKRVLVSRVMEGTIGCGDRCAALCAYTKSSMRRAIAGGDLTRDARCTTCNLLASVGEARSHRISHTILVPEMVETIELVKEDYEVEESYTEEQIRPAKFFIGGCKIGKMSIDPTIMAPAVKVGISDVNPAERTSGMERNKSKAEQRLQGYFDGSHKKCAVVAPLAHNMQKPPPNFETLKSQGSALIEEYEAAQAKLYASKPLVSDGKRFGKIVHKNGCSFIKSASKERIRVCLEEERKWSDFEKAFVSGEFEDAVHPGESRILSYVCRGEQVSFASPYSKVPTLKRLKQPKTIKRLELTEQRINDITREVCKIAKKSGMKLEFVSHGKHALNVRYKKLNSNVVACVNLPHESGFKKTREIHPRKFNNEIKILLGCNTFEPNFSDEDVVRGFSGAILPKARVNHVSGNYDEMVVRGRCDGQLVDARVKVSYHMMHRMTHYSAAEKDFWNGWKKQFDAASPNVDHICVPDLTDEQCGEIAAGVFQRMHPCKKISCAVCRGAIEKLDRDDYYEFIDKHARGSNVAFWKLREKYASARIVLDNADKMALINPDIESMIEITRIVQGSPGAQMQHLSNIQAALMKGATATGDDLSKAMKSLLELSRWFKNHLSQIEKGDVAVFRNKASSKASINFSLLCDNQLDRNGNFVWGERGRHSKRFFSNFFEEVTPGDGYAKYVERVNPNGSRKLAIGHLVVPLDLERAREALEGIPIDLRPVSQACISKTTSFEYTCCCVTNDSGKPYYSSIKSPTKSHLVIGNTGDAKYVDLPSIENEKMFVAKEGYCYVNIFLAMLVNVNEDSAKDFTKRVRDIIIPRLGKWPTMYDLAAACYMLTVFHPETRNAELPRILVDHDNQMMHVIDSFGSLNTGYHVLKAGTIQQLLPFARKTLEGEMKFYRVGGDLSKVRRNNMEITLLRSIYRPKQLLSLIETEPYILFLSLVTPKLIVALYNTGGLDAALSHWIDKDTSLSTSFTILATLAQKVSRVKSIQEQIDNINAAAGKIFEILSRDGIHTMSKFDVMLFIESISNRAAIDLNLVRNGFVSFESSLFEAREKIYAQRLSASWRGLNLWEKFTAIRVYYLRRSPSTDVLTEPDTKGVEDKYAISCGWFCDKIQEVHAGIKRSVRTRLERCTQSVRGLIVKRVSNLLNRCFSDVFYMVNVLLLISMFTSVVTFVKQYFDKANEAKLTHKYNEHRVKMQEVESIYSIYVKAYGTPTEDEFFRFICKHRPDLQDFIEKMFDKVELQSKTYLELNFEKIVAFMALITMMFDEKKSDLVFKVLNKVKSVFGTFGEVVRLQGLDEIDSVESEKKETVDFVLQTDDVRPYELPGSRFEDWWRNQLNQNRVVPHYRLTGRFIEFTRNTLVQVCNTIITSDEKEFLIRGAVGSGKSTGLPNQLCKKGRVLLLEPTRPLAENVCKQLRKDPFYNNATLRMRGLNSFGSSNVTIMTSGFALHYFAHNQAQLDDIAFVIIDECHVIDASTMAFYCLLMEYSFQGKILRVSATPPGRECEFTPQQPVKVKIEENASFSEFVAAQGTGCNLDVIQDGDNILVYVASYNDVDALGKSLLERGFMVTKVDGRTMKLGGVEIITKGSSSVKHFVVATNIIENGVTLDVDVVVDFGLKVQAELDSDLRCMRYSKIPISYGERIQRLGRVGRVKPGTALRIGHTEKTISEIPVSVATEAAFICFAYGLPVMTHNVTTSMLSKCSVVQARTILNFELSCFFMVDLVSMNGMMHPLIHEELKKFKLRDSEMTLSKLSIPSACVNKWISARDYHRYGVKTKLNEDVRIPFFASNIPERTIENIWKIVCDNKHDAGFGQLKLVNACKIAYTLSIDDTVLPKTIGIIDTLIQQEMEKRAHFENMTSSLTSHSFSLQGIVNRVKSRYLKDYTSQNIQTLQIVRAQIIEFSTATHDLTKPQSLLPYGFLDIVQLEGSDAISARLGLKGVWNESIMTQDVVVLLMLSIGGAWMLWDYFRYRAQDVVLLHGKRRVQKLKFRDARDRKIGREVYADDGTIERMFGEAYTARGKVKGSNKKKGMGNKNRNFVHLYGFDPTEYSFVRFLDPLTGATIDDTINADLQLIQEEFGDIRRQAILDDDITKNAIDANPGIRAYFANPKTHKAIKVDLHPHNPLLMCKRATSIAGFPEREFELRQSGDAKVINFSEVPPEQSQVKLEGKSILRGPRDYNPVARSVCQITNISDGHRYSMYAIGYGSILIAPGHFFQRNNGDFEIQSHMGFFKVTNTTTLKIHHLEGRDLILIRMPKDFPPFPQRLRFRHPIPKEKCCMVSSIYQQKSMSSSVSETTVVMPTEGCHYWKHWITSSEGSCGLPLVSTKDGFLLGIHGLGGVVTDKNYFVTFPEDFEENILHKMDQLDWRVKWKYNVDKVLWGRLCYAENEEDAMFKVNKLARDLVKCDDDFVCMQGTNNGWVLHELSDNLKAVATTESHLVTKHTVKGRCEYFQKYLNENEQAYAYFKPLMSQYGPSRLNKDAFKKDFFKYKPAIIVGLVDDQRFERSVDALIQMMEGLNFKKCNFVTDADEIIDSLNMKASVGAMFKGKKKEYFDLLNDSEREDLLMKSCLRLFRNDMGVWNGSLKAELRHIDKINMNKTRTFTAAPIDTLLGAKSCVDDFNNQFYSLNCVGPWTVGMSKFYRGWHSFLTSLPDGWIYCHADGSRFDSSLTPYLINAIVTVREHFMEDWDVGRTMLHNLYTEVVYTPILTPDGTIVKKFKGNNSGQPSTVVDNTLMVIVAVYYALSATVEELSEIGDFIKFFANGDDLVIAIEPSRVSILDGFKASFGELGLDYDFSERSFDRCDIEFMSHKGLLKDEVYIPKLDKERIVSILEWDRSKEIAHRAEAICAAMIEAWGYDDLLYEIRKFYAWMMDLAEFRDLANVGTFPYIAESALRKLYLDVDASVDELRAYLHVIDEPDEDELDIVVLQGDRSELDAGASSSRRSRTQPNEQALAVPSEAVARDRDVDTGTSGRSVPRLKSMSRKMRMPKINAEILLDLEQLLEYKPEQVDLSNTRATHKQLETWHKAIQEELEVTPEQLKIILNGFMVWCIENGTSPNLNGVWTMMDGDEQVEFPLKPFIENAKPTLRQIMHHFSDAAEAYIEFRNSERVYIPRYALKRNLRDASLARFAFDFYEMHAKTPIRAREAHLQMKAAALSNVSTKMFGLDGNIATQEENTERHVASDVNPDMHTLLGVRHM